MSAWRFVTVFIPRVAGVAQNSVTEHRDIQSFSTLPVKTLGVCHPGLRVSNQREFNLTRPKNLVESSGETTFHCKRVPTRNSNRLKQFSLSEGYSVVEALSSLLLVHV